MKTASGFLCVFVLLVSSAATGASLEIVATGDSITWSYYLYFPQQFAGTALAQNTTLDFKEVAAGGLNASSYSGVIGGVPTSHSYAQEVVDLHPDVILFLLGANDACDDQLAEANFATYKQIIPQVFELWKDVPQVIVSTILPMVGSQWNNANQRISDWYNPFLVEQARKYGFTIWDNHDLIQQQNDWQSFFWIDGLHPYGITHDDSGSKWLAGSFRDAVVSTVPEPGMLAYLWVLGACLGVWVRHRGAR
jgi:lysophospholipase L1-like esterase